MDAGVARKEALTAVTDAIASGKVTLERASQLEKQLGHDVLAMVTSIVEQVPPEIGSFVHMGATSQDLNDTVLALQLAEAKHMLLVASMNVRRELTRLAVQYRDLACLGRTHGQQSLPVTLGFKFANFLYEVAMAETFLQRVQVYGKLSGTVGTHASIGPAGIGIQKAVMEALGINAAPISTQTVTRLYISDFVFALTSVASALERIAKEVRNLQRTEIAELCEGGAALDLASLAGSSSKRNPHKSERICGLARVVRSQLGPVLESSALEHERDLTHSSVERISLPTAACLTHYMLLETSKVLATLAVDVDHIRANLYAGGGRQVGERVLAALEARVGRGAAHDMLKKHTGVLDFSASVRADAVISGVIPPTDLDALLDPATYVGQAPAIVDDIVKMYGAPVVVVGGGGSGGGAGGGAARK